MFRTLAASLQPDLAPRTTAPQAAGARHNDLRLQWSVKDGRPTARWVDTPTTLRKTTDESGPRHCVTSRVNIF